MPQDLAAQIIALRADVAKAQKMRAEAEANLGVAKQRLQDIDAELKKLGLDPENADTELAALERQLEKTVSELQMQVSAEVKTYNEIITASKAVVGGVG